MEIINKLMLIRCVIVLGMVRAYGYYYHVSDN